MECDDCAWRRTASSWRSEMVCLVKYEMLFKGDGGLDDLFEQEQLM